MNIIKYTKQEFPLNTNKWALIIPISVFIALFLIIFQPFGISYIQENKLLILAGYGFTTFIILIIELIIIEKLFPKIFNEKNWTIGKEFLWLLCIIFSIGLGNAIYTSLVFNFFKVTFYFIIKFQIITLIIGAIPISLLIVSKQKYLLKNHLKSANGINQKLENKKQLLQQKNIYFNTGDKKNQIEFQTNNFLYIESSGNYIDLYLLDKNKVIRKTFRNTLKKSIQYFKDIPEIIQCHRAFIVNTNKIQNVKGNSQGLKLQLEDCQNEIPVSRAFVEKIKKQINKQ